MNPIERAALLEEIKGTAFAKWLLSRPAHLAEAYLFTCISHGPSENNAAWQLWEAVHGDKEFRPDQVQDALSAMIKALK